MKVYIVVEPMHGGNPPRIVGVFRNRTDAEKAAYSRTKMWCNIIEKEVK